MQTWTVEITDHWPQCPGTIVQRGFSTRKAAANWAAREVEAVREHFTDERAKLTVKIRKETK